MSYGTIEGTTWPVDTDDVEWKLRYNPTALTTNEALFAASVMAAYSHLTDPMVSDEDAQNALRRARLVVADVNANVAELLAESVSRNWVVEIDNALFGPFTYPEAQAWIIKQGQGIMKEMKS